MEAHRSAGAAARVGERRRSRSAFQPLPQCMKVRYERGALADLEAIFEYIAADNPRAAAPLLAVDRRLGSRRPTRRASSRTMWAVPRPFPAPGCCAVSVGGEQAGCVGMASSCGRLVWP